MVIKNDDFSLWGVHNYKKVEVIDKLEEDTLSFVASKFVKCVMMTEIETIEGGQNDVSSVEV